jgi:hypothetical protein
MKPLLLFAAPVLAALALAPAALKAQAAAAAPIAPPAPAVTIEGDWMGTLGTPDALQHVTWHFVRDGAGWVCSVDDPERGATGVNCSLTSAANPVAWEVPIVSAKFTGTMTGNTITGTYSEGGVDTPSTFTRGVVVASAAPAGGGN